jgi:hypothetical protein
MNIPSLSRKYNPSMSMDKVELRSRQQVVLDDASLGSGNYGFTSIMLP